MSERKRTVGSLTHADCGKSITLAGYGTGTLWAIQHVAAIGDIPEPWTRLTLRRRTYSEATRGMPPGTPVVVSSAPEGT